MKLKQSSSLLSFQSASRKSNETWNPPKSQKTIKTNKQTDHGRFRDLRWNVNYRLGENLDDHQQTREQRRLDSVKPRQKSNRMAKKTRNESPINRRDTEKARDLCATRKSDLSAFRYNPNWIKGTKSSLWCPTSIRENWKAETYSWRIQEFAER